MLGADNGQRGSLIERNNNGTMFDVWAKGAFPVGKWECLCKTCEPTIIREIQSRARIIKDCMKLVDESKNLKTRLSRCDLLIEHAQALLKYQEKGIPTITPSPSQLLAEYSAMRDQIILDSLTAEAEKMLAKAEIEATPRTSINEANKVLLRIQEGKQELQDSSKLDHLEKRVRRFKHETQLNAYLEAAHKAEFKGQKKKALDQYQEALYFLQTDEIDDSLQKGKIGEIKTKISELSD